MYNRELEKINTEVKAYFLGLMYSDGSISYNKNNYSSCTKLKLKRSDKAILEQLHKEFPFFKLQFDKTCKSKSWFLISYNKQLYEDLCNVGLVPKKSTINKELLVFPVLHSNLVPHFIRGLWDGDGNVQNGAKTSKNYKRFRLYMTNTNIINSTWKILKYYKIDCSYKKYKNRTPIILTVNSTKENSEKFKNLIYSNCNIYLQRKYIQAHM